MRFLFAVLLAHVVLFAQPSANPRFKDATVSPVLPPGPGNPRNTEGSFVTLRDGRILYAYTRFTGGTGDHDSASIVGRHSSDGGRTWSREDVAMLSGEGAMNVMSVSLLRLKDGRIALFYLRKNSVTDCLPCMRHSRDEGRTWSDPAVCVPADGYYVLNNDRVVQLRSGRIVLPVAYHPPIRGGFGSRGIAMAFLSDDGGANWRSSKTRLESASPDRAGFQEPGIVELKDGRVMMFIRTQLGTQYVSFSSDGCDTWTEARASNIASPLSPASIERIPSTDDLLMVWNDHSAVEESLRRKRTPLTVAISRDEGRTWTRKRNILRGPRGLVLLHGNSFLQESCSAGVCRWRGGLPPLSRTSMAVFDVGRLYR